MSLLNINLIYFVLILFGFFLSNRALKLDKVFLFFYIVFTFIVCFLLIPSVDNYSRDFNNYYNWFLKIYSDGVVDGFFGKDPLFQYIVLLIQLFFGSSYIPIYSFFFIAISVLKFYFSKFLNIGFYYLIFLWLLFCQTFILHDLTQIRGGLAIAVCSFFIIRDLNNRNNLNVILIFCSFFIHQSVSVLILSYLVYLLLGSRVLTRKLILFIYFLGIFSGFFLKNILSSYLLIHFISNERASDYLDSTYGGVFEASLVSTFFLLKSLSIFILTYFYEELDDVKKFFVLLSSIGCFFYSVFLFNSVFAYRFSEVFIYFSIATMIYPLYINKVNIEARYAWFVGLIVLGWVFFYSSTKILPTH